jgi:hypothetical protein
LTSSQSVSPHERVPDEVGAFIYVDITSVNQSLSWDAFIAKSRHTCKLSPGVQHLNHPASTILHQYKKCGVLVIMKIAKWSVAKIYSTIKRVPHKSALKEWIFLQQEFDTMMHKGQWTVLPDPLV